MQRETRSREKRNDVGRNKNKCGKLGNNFTPNYPRIRWQDSTWTIICWRDPGSYVQVLGRAHRAGGRIPTKRNHPQALLTQLKRMLQSGIR